MDDTPHNPATIPAPGTYHWTRKLQREFLEQLAITGSVKIASAMVCMSPAAAYQLKQRPQGKAFALGWAAAVLMARGRLADELLDRAIWGIDEMTDRGNRTEMGAQTTQRKRQDPRLGLAMLARLDKMVETRARAGEEMLAQIIAGDWPGFLSLFDVAPENAGAEGQNSGMAAALALWLAGRDNRANPLATLWRGTAIANEVAQISAASAAAPEPELPAEPTPDEEAAAMTVWHDDRNDEWRTDFPPPEGFDGIEEGVFGDGNYERTLDAAEEEAWESARAEAFAPLRVAGEVARRAFFALPANDPEPAGGAANETPRKSATG